MNSSNFPGQSPSSGNALASANGCLSGLSATRTEVDECTPFSVCHVIHSEQPIGKRCATSDGQSPRTGYSPRRVKVRDGDKPATRILGRFR
jgi:hypothetical protein